MKSIRTKITYTYIVLAFFIVAVVGVISSIKIESFFHDRLLRDLAKQADLLVFSLQRDSSFPIAQVDQHLKELARLENIRITLIDSAGTVVADSDVPFDRLASVENHLNRPEIQDAATRGLGSAARHSETVKRDFLYLAKRISHEHSKGVLDKVAFVRVSVQLHEVQESVRDIRLNIFTAGSIVLLLVIGASWFVSRKISNPMVEIAQIAERIRAGNLDERIPVKANDEIGQVAQAVNELVDKLKTDIVQLKKLERIRSEFLGNVSHELRTPIFAVQGFLETLLNGAIDDPSVSREFVGKAFTQAARLNSLLNDLIDISRIESGEMKMSFRYFPLREFLEQIVAEMQQVALQKHITLTLQSDNTPVEVLGDKERLKQVLFNLIDNAVKYNTPNGRVEVSCERTDGKVKISVKDLGVGIPEEHLPRIFERFYRVDKERSREAGGTGLGLAIVKHIVEAHGSKVEVRSEIGKGSTFGFELNR